MKVMGRFLGRSSGVCSEEALFLIEPTVVYQETCDRRKRKATDGYSLVVRSDPFWGKIFHSSGACFSPEKAKQLMTAIASAPVVDLDDFDAAFFYAEDRTPEFYPVANYWDEVTGETEPLVVMQKD